MKIKLIYPSVVKEYKKGEVFFTELWFPLLTFPILAAYTPGDVEVEIIDEAIEDIDFDDPVDLVGLTAMTHTINRAYRIADEYRKRGVKTVIGGFHVTVFPDEALEHVDAVVLGEGENTWPQVMEDLKKGQLKSRYTSPGLFDMAKYRTPKVELLSRYLKPPDQYEPPYYPSLNVIEVSRGCPFKCSYCAVANFYGKKHRLRPVEDVLKEIRLRKLQSRLRFIAFSDDNLYGNPAYFRELLKGLKKLNVNWSSQISLNIARSPDLLPSMVESGCQTVGFGIESINQESLKSVNKHNNKVDEYDELLEQVKKYNIRIFFAMMLGFDHDDESIFEKTSQWVKKHIDSIIYLNFHILTPLPGTAVYHQFKKENRIFDFNWRHYDTRHVVYKPKLMSAETLYRGYKKLLEELVPITNTNWEKWYLR